MKSLFAPKLPNVSSCTACYKPIKRKQEFCTHLSTVKKIEHHAHITCYAQKLVCNECFREDPHNPKFLSENNTPPATPPGTLSRSFLKSFSLEALLDFSLVDEKDKLQQRKSDDTCKKVSQIIKVCGFALVGVAAGIGLYVFRDKVQEIALKSYML